MPRDTSTCVSSQNLDTHHTATSSRLPLSEIQNLRRLNTVDARKYQALQKPAKLPVVTFENSQSRGSTLRRGASHIRPKLQITPSLHRDTIADSQSGDDQASPPSPPSSSNTLYSKSSLSKSVCAPNRCLDRLSLAKSLFTSNTRHDKPHRLQVTPARSKLTPSSKPRAQRSRVRFPDPHKDPPDSYAAALWRHVRAKIATMNGPATAATPSVTATSAPESHSKLDQAFKDLEIDHGVHCDPQFSTVISTEDAPAIVSILRSETKEGSTTLDLIIGVESVFFRRSERSTIETKSYDAWTVTQPTHEQLANHGHHIIDHELNTASKSYSLAADATWNNRFQRGIPGLLRSAKVFDANMRCSQFLTVTVGTAELSSLHEQWVQQAEQELSKQLSVLRANAEEDRWVVLTGTRYYGYLISGLNLEIHDMVYRPNLSHPRIPVQLKQSQGQSGDFGTKGSASNTVPKPTNPMKSSSRPNPEAALGIPSSKSPTIRPNSTTTSRTPSSNVPTSRPRTSSRTTSPLVPDQGQHRVALPLRGQRSIRKQQCKKRKTTLSPSPHQ